MYFVFICNWHILGNFKRKKYLTNFKIVKLDPHIIDKF